jgi:hypothetical protein
MISVSGYLLLIIFTLTLCLIVTSSLLYVKIAIFFNVDDSFKKYYDFIDTSNDGDYDDIIANKRIFYNSLAENNDVIKTVADGFKLINAISWSGNFIL